MQREGGTISHSAEKEFGELVEQASPEEFSVPVQVEGNEEVEKAKEEFEDWKEDGLENT